MKVILSMIWRVVAYTSQTKKNYVLAEKWKVQNQLKISDMNLLQNLILWVEYGVSKIF